MFFTDQQTVENYIFTKNEKVKDSYIVSKFNSFTFERFIEQNPGEVLTYFAKLALNFQ